MRVGKAVKDFEPAWAQWDGTAETESKLNGWAAVPNRTDTDVWFAVLPMNKARYIYGDIRYTAEVYDFLHSRWIPLRTGDVVMKGPKGECYPCAQVVFNEGPDKTYTITEEWTV